jgi:hypothetical protein
MNNVEIVEWWRYRMQDLPWIWSSRTYELFIIKLVKIKHWFIYVDWIIYKEWEDSNLEQIIPLSEFKEKVLYKV